MTLRVLVIDTELFQTTSFDELIRQHTNGFPELLLRLHLGSSLSVLGKALMVNLNHGYADQEAKKAWIHDANNVREKFWYHGAPS